MERSKIIMVPILILTLLFSCQKESEDISIESNFLSELEIGDEIRYLFFEGESYADENNFDFSYSQDTLIIKVENILDDKFIISETISPGSNMLNSSESYYWGEPEKVFENIWEIKNDSLNVRPLEEENALRSHLFQKNVTGLILKLPLSLFNEEQVDVIGWKTTTPYTESNKNMFAVDVSILGIAYEEVNIAIRNSYMILDGPGTTYFFNKNKGIIRVSKYSWWTSNAQGWDKF